MRNLWRCGSVFALTLAVLSGCATETSECTESCGPEGRCGSADGVARVTAPASGLCAGGTASTVDGDGPWTWTCVGSDGAASASCSAPLAAPDGTVNLSAATFRVSEADGASGAGFFLRSTSPHQVSVKLATQDGTAIAGQDYTAISTTLALAAGDSQWLYVQIIDNAVREGDRTFQLVLSDPLGGAALGEIASATVTIVDDEAPPAGIIEFPSAWFDHSAPVLVGAYAGQTTVPVSRHGGSTGAVSIHYATTGGTATPDDDYTPVSGILTWEDGDTTDKSFVIPIVRDVAHEDLENIIVELSDPAGGAALGIRTPVYILPYDGFQHPEAPVLTAAGGSTAFDAHAVTDPSVVQLAPDSFVMFYTGLKSSSATIGRAVSTDGITWTKSPTTAVTSFAASQPSVLFDGATWHMWHTIPGATAIGYATSPDGLTWTQQNSGDPVLVKGVSLEWDSDGVGSPSVMLHDGQYTMWYTGTGIVGPAAQIGRATSSDGVTWTKDLASPVLLAEQDNWDATAVRDPSVIQDGATYWMIYTGTTIYWRLGIAMSSDGVTWTKHPDPLMFLYNDAWDQDGYSGPSVLLVGETMTVWYSGSHSGGPESIGRATNR